MHPWAGLAKNKHVGFHNLSSKSANSDFPFTLYVLARHYTTGGYAAAIFPLGEYGPLTMHDKEGKKMQPVQVVVGEAVITWRGAGRCRHTIADVDEPSKKRQLFIFGVLCVRLVSDYEDWDSESRRRSSTQGETKQPFSHHGPSRPPKISKLFWLELRRRWNRTV